MVSPSGGFPSRYSVRVVQSHVPGYSASPLSHAPVPVSHVRMKLRGAISVPSPLKTSSPRVRVKPEYSTVILRRFELANAFAPKLVQLGLTTMQFPAMSLASLYASSSISPLGGRRQSNIRQSSTEKQSCAWAQATKHATAMARMNEEARRSILERLGGFSLLTPAQRPAQPWLITSVLGTLLQASVNACGTGGLLATRECFGFFLISALFCLVFFPKNLSFGGHLARGLPTERVFWRSPPPFYRHNHSALNATRPPTVQFWM